MKFLGQFKKCICLSLDLRSNEWEELENQVKALDGKFEQFIVGKGKVLPKEMYDRIDDPNQDLGPWNRTYTHNAFHCHYSHRAMFEKLKREGVGPDDKILLMEDDCRFMDGFQESAQKAQDDIDRLNIDWDLLYLGGNHTWSTTKPVTENLFKLLGGTYCFHATAIKGRMIDHLLSLPKTGPFDWLTSLETQKKYDCYALWPNLAIQKPGASNVNGQIEDYTGYFSNKGH